MSNNDFALPTNPLQKSPVKPTIKKSGAAPSTSEIKPEMAEKVESNEKNGPTGPKYDQNELLRIFDEIIFNGEYIEEVIIRGRVPVRFSTRTAEQVGEIQDALDGAGLTLISSIEQRRSIMSLEQSLASFNGKDLAGMPKDDRSKFVGRLAAPVIAMLLNAMAEFDLKIAAACREEANF